MNINDQHGSSQRQKATYDTLTHHEIDRIIATANADPETTLTGAFVQVLSSTGIRTGEFENLMVSDIDEQAGLVSITSGKSSYRQRRIPLCLKSREALHVLCADRGDSEYVLGNSAAKRVRHFAKQFSDITKKLGIAPCPLHSLRRGFAASLKNSGVDLYVLQHIMGHSSIDDTKSKYHPAEPGALCCEPLEAAERGR